MTGFVDTGPNYPGKGIGRIKSKLLRRLVVVGYALLITIVFACVLVVLGVMGLVSIVCVAALTAKDGIVDAVESACALGSRIRDLWNGR